MAPIPLPNISHTILTKIIEYCKYHHENPLPDDKTEDMKRLDNIHPWDKKFTEVDQDTLFQFILAANYLDIKSLLELTCKTVALMIKGKSPEEIRKTFSMYIFLYILTHW
jgi:S-phase kinase-associated protein 1